MDFELSDKSKEYLERLAAFMDEHVYPNEKTYLEQIDAGDRWQAVSQNLPPIYAVKFG